jgi:hypothetical protein
MMKIYSEKSDRFDQLEDAKRGEGWDDFVKWTRMHQWEGDVANALIALAAGQTYLFVDFVSMLSTDENKAVLKAFVHGLITNEIGRGVLPADLWDRWEIVVTDGPIMNSGIVRKTQEQEPTNER